MRCKNCRYSLANLTGPPHRCPECGRYFDLNDPRTFESAAGRRADMREWLRLVAGFTLLAMLLAAGPVLVVRSERPEAPFVVTIFALLVAYYGIRIYRTRPRS